MGLAQVAQLPPSVTSRNKVAAGALLVLVTSNENFRPDVRDSRNDN